MNWDIVGTIATLLVFASLVLYVIENRRTLKANRRIADEYRDLNESGKRLLGHLTEASDELTTAGLALCTAMHSHFRVDDEALPGLTLVTCDDCGESLGSVSDPGDVLTLANVHVKEKFEAMRITAAATAKAEEEVKQDQS